MERPGLVFVNVARTGVLTEEGRGTAVDRDETAEEKWAGAGSAEDP